MDSSEEHSGLEEPIDQPFKEESEEEVEYVEDNEPSMALTAHFGEKPASTLPSWVSQDVKNLQDMLNSLNQEVSNTDALIEERQERLSNLKRHQKDVSQEIDTLQNIMAEETSTLQNISDRKAILQRNEAKLKDDIKRYHRSIEDEENRAVNLSEYRTKQEDMLVKAKGEIIGAENNLERYFNLFQIKISDVTQLNANLKRDSGVARDHMMRISKLLEAIVEVDKKIKEEVSLSRIKEQEIAALTQQFKNLYDERLKTLAAWKDVVEKIVNLDAQIGNRRDLFLENKNTLMEKKRFLEGRLKILETERKALLKIDKKIEHAMTQKANDSIQLQNIKTDVDDLKHYLGVLKNGELSIDKALSDIMGSLQVLESNITNVQKSSEKQEQKLKEKNEILYKMKNENQMSDAEASKLNDELVAKEVQLNQLIKSREALSKKLFTKSSDLFALKQESERLENLVSSSEIQRQNIEDQITSLEQQSNKQEELLYQYEFQIASLQRKIARARGVRSREEREKLNAVIAELSNEHADLNKKNKFLKQQLNKVVDEVQSSKKTLSMREIEIEKLEGIRNNTELQIKFITSDMKKIKSEVENLLIQRDSTALKINQLQEEVEETNSIIFDLKNRINELELIISEKRIQILSHLGHQKEQIKLMNVSIQAKSLDCSDLKKRARTLEEKFATEESKLSKNVEVFEHAAERQKLQVQGDEYHERILTLTQQIMEGEKILQSIRDSNNALKTATDVEKSTEEALRQEIERLENRLTELSRTKQELSHELAFQDETKIQLSTQTEQLNETIKSAEHRLHNINMEIQQQEAKAQRARGMLRRSVSLLSGKESVIELLNQEYRVTLTDVHKSLTRIPDAQQLLDL
ncbi:hypothetical protein PCE1_001831 [Barthelona sp. PCE]